MSKWVFWRKKTVVKEPARGDWTQGYLTLDDDGSLFGFHETIEEAQEVVAYWKAQDVVMHIHRGEAA